MLVCSDYSAKKSIGRQASLDSTQNQGSFLDASEIYALAKQSGSVNEPKAMNSFIIEDSLNQSENDEAAGKASATDEPEDSFVAPTRKLKQVLSSEEEDDQGDTEEEDEDDNDGDDDEGDKEIRRMRRKRTNMFQLCQ